ncbi:MAG: PilZ domain-containing protein [Hyphomonas sp.]|uniref:PilZ domain-containing protein n=1 Tax=Hyphomonas sp. TaxID=87 RepID=UPI003528D40D
MSADFIHSPEDGGKGDDHRSAPRHRVLKGARIVYNGGSSSGEVVIRDLSDTGAKVKLSDVWIVPSRVDLLILNPNTGHSERRACERRWQRGVMVGLRFLDAAQTDTRGA